MVYGVAARQPLGVALYRRVVAINTGLLIVAALVLAFSPATVSRHMTVEEWVVLALGTTLAVVVNVLLLRRVFEPLQRLQAIMRRIDPRTPGQRVGIDESHVEEVAAIVELSLAQSDGATRLRVRDDGAGISDDRLHDGGGGIAGMRERALLIGGSLRVGVARQGGTEVILEVPA